MSGRRGFYCPTADAIEPPLRHSIQRPLRSFKDEKHSLLLLLTLYDGTPLLRVRYLLYGRSSLTNKLLAQQFFRFNFVHLESSSDVQPRLLLPYAYSTRSLL